MGKKGYISEFMGGVELSLTAKSLTSQRASSSRVETRSRSMSDRSTAYQLLTRF